MINEFCEKRVFESGLVCLHTASQASTSLSETLRAELESQTIGFGLVYFCQGNYHANEIIELMAEVASELSYAACTTAGEITPMGLDDGQIMILLFPKKHFQFQANQLDTKSQDGIEAIAGRVTTLEREFVLNNPTTNNFFALCLMDGASFKEEAITAALHWGLESTPLLGGSAGDDLSFTKTTLILNGEQILNGVVLMFVSTDLQTEMFKTENFIPSEQKLVVTKSDPRHRIIYEFNAAPAAIEYANILGTDPGSLTPQSFASRPLVMRVGGHYFCRSIQKVNDDHSLSFFCAVDDGIVLTVAEQTGMARTTKKALCEVDERVGGIDFVLGFDCVLRKLDARNRQVTQKISKIYQDHNVLGFNTYGEQYQSMHLNQTLTGVAFGRPEKQS